MIIAASATSTMPFAAASRRRVPAVRRASLWRARRGVDVEGDLARRGSTRVEAAEDEVGVGDGRVGAAAAVAGRTRVGAGAVRTDAEHAAGVDPGDAAAAGADLDEVDRPGLDRVAAATVAAAIGRGAAPTSYPW